MDHVVNNLFSTLKIDYLVLSYVYLVMTPFYLGFVIIYIDYFYLFFYLFDYFKIEKIAVLIPPKYLNTIKTYIIKFFEKL